MPHRKLQRVLAVLFAAFLLYAVLFASAGWTVRDRGWYRREYSKYEALAAVNGRMDMHDALDVTQKMIEYLCGERDQLQVRVPISGKEQPFFSRREERHLKDCRTLFIGALRLRTAAVISCMLIVLILAFLNRSLRQVVLTISGIFAPAAGVIIAAAGLAGIVISTDFDFFFIRFHQFFFNNNDWLLNPASDNLINLLPERFFIDTGIRILITFLIAAGLLCALSVWIHRRLKTGRRDINETTVS